MKTQKEIKLYHNTFPNFVIEGNIYDIYTFNHANMPSIGKLQDVLNLTFQELQYDGIISFIPFKGVKLLNNASREIVEKDLDIKFNKEGIYDLKIEDLPNFLEKVYESKLKTVFIINYSEKLKNLIGNDNPIWFNNFQLLNSKDSLSKVVIVTEKVSELPVSYFVNNPRVRTLNVSLPDLEERKTIINNLQYNNAGNLSDLTKGFKGIDILNLVTLLKENNNLNTEDMVRLYRAGLTENSWKKLNIEKIENAQSILSESVKGQERAIEATVEVIKKSVVGLNGAHKSSDAPRGVFIFAGPTGVGKTELAKSLTKLLFAHEDSYIRFDMSEYSQEHSNQILLGAPPGYVGYENGGKLINAVKANPSSIILFDEIEKAHPRILDIFLQILEDGRLTSGSGETVYFSESLIIFTTNLGVYNTDESGNRIENINTAMPYNEIENNVKKSIEEFFIRINRKEIYGRIGKDNVLVFDFIRNNVAKEILDKMIKNVTLKLKSLGIELTKIESDVITSIEKFCFTNLSLGGRGVGNRLETCFINPLSSVIFDTRIKEGDRIRVVSIKENPWKIKIEKE